MALCASDSPEVVDILKNKLFFANGDSLNPIITIFVSANIEGGLTCY